MVFEGPADQRAKTQPQKQRHVKHAHGDSFMTLWGDISDIGLYHRHQHGGGDSVKKTDDNQRIDGI